MPSSMWSIEEKSVGFLCIYVYGEFTVVYIPASYAWVIIIEYYILFKCAASRQLLQEIRNIIFLNKIVINFNH